MTSIWRGHWPRLVCVGAAYVRNFISILLKYFDVLKQYHM